MEIAVIGVAGFNRHTRKGKSEICVITFQQIEEVIDNRLAILDPQEAVDLREKIPKEYHNYLDIFSKKASDQLLSLRKKNYRLTLDPETSPGETIGNGPLYKMSIEELEAAKQYIIENLDKGFIISSGVPFASPILMAKKPDGGLRFCVDYRRLNSITQKDRYPFPLIKTDASDETIAGVLSQEFERSWHPVTYYSKSMSGPERNYDIHDKEMLAIIYALKEWRPELEGLQRTDRFKQAIRNERTLTTQLCVLENLKGIKIVDQVLAANRSAPSLEDQRAQAQEPNDNWSLQDGLLLHQRRLVVPEEDLELRTRFLEKIYSQRSTAHPGRMKTRRLFQQRFYWPEWGRDVNRYIRNCQCQTDKVPRDKTPGLLQSLPVPLQYQAKWSNADDDPTWYPASNFIGCPHLVQEYYRQYPDKPEPPRRLGAWLEAYNGEEEFEITREDELPV
ncbi:retrovirus polyprotein [Aspergillus affinis]|uniref:retrovirus polyprotein n=1 Tax=Aspergillus affinis TaxID=1070780 RepID=UPI0022FEA179|nr:retrovirus polyprotein [Aspergillus affinis]KAI9035392.1 retrovirus polyprotein [Aspergillus affinis]